eukprot:TRINITY_DN12418_c0_g1_i1.p2 TRINITY_DN12418_c0_g1~~TRINITY_DN12418_c0_g1_i1.p2  ORF type:complete len:159 (+),score=33.34 TRINITY_DN12418_c0_g1_i1:30-506(+)
MAASTLSSLPPEEKKQYTAARDSAKAGLLEGEVPCGAVLAVNGKTIGVGRDRRVQKRNFLHHATMDCLENAGRLKAAEYKQSVLYTTSSLCPMCAGAVLLFGIPKIVIGENTNFAGEVELLRSRGVEVFLLNDEDIFRILKRFIDKHQVQWQRFIGAQ